MRPADRGADGSPPMAVTVRPMTAGDAAAVLRIYQAGLDTQLASFETVAPAWAVFDADKLAEHRFVAIDEAGTVVGWVAVSATSRRQVYAGVVEHSVYVDPAPQGHGVGRLLLDALVASTESAGIWTIQSGIFPENTPSLALHRAAGFREVGRRERVGLMGHGPLAGQWRDVIFIERRSADERAQHPGENRSRGEGAGQPEQRHSRSFAARLRSASESGGCGGLLLSLR